MYVGRVMHTDLVTVTPDASLEDARELIAEKRIAHLLVVDSSGNLIGVLSDRDLKQSWASPATTLSKHELNYLLKKLTIDMIMVKKTITIPPDTTIERAALIMQKHRISALPVIENEKLVGIITTTDVMDMLLQAIGIDDDSSRFTVLVDDRIGRGAEVLSILKENEVNMRSLVSWPEKQHPGIYHLVMRVGAAQGEKAISALTQAGFKVMTEYVEDLRPYLPQS
jgi:acetoin utilization protein AcuB